MTAESPERLQVLRGREQVKRFTANVDVVIVGSGAGGAVVARELARDGRSVVVLEEGGHSPQEYGALAPLAFVPAARARGGDVRRPGGRRYAAHQPPSPASASAGRASSRAPFASASRTRVLHTWSDELGLSQMTPEHVEPYFFRGRTHLSRRDRPRAHALAGHRALRQGRRFARHRDEEHAPQHERLRGAARCNFGCPNGAKMSVDVSFLPEAVRHGATVVSDALVERIDTAGGRARGVRWSLLDGVTGEPGFHSKCARRWSWSRADRCTPPSSCAGAVSPRSTSGRHLTLHPGVRIGALFDERSTAGTARCRASTAITTSPRASGLNGVYTAVNVLAAAFPGIGPEHRRLVKKIPNLAFFGGMVHDDGGGQVRAGSRESRSSRTR